MTAPRLRTGARGLMLCALLGVLPVRAHAQDRPEPVRATLVLIAGADLHLELHDSPRLQPRDTLVVQRDGTVRGALVVVAADSARALVAFADVPFALTRGAAIEAELRRADPTAPGAAPVGAEPQAAPTPGYAAPDSAAPAGRHADRGIAAGTARAPLTRTGGAPGPHASGYLATDTRWIRQRTGTETESYGVPSATVSMRVTNLPARASMHVFARAEHYPDALRSEAFGDATRVRVYAARIEARAGPIRIGLGRLTSQHDPFAGPWDGLALEVGDRLSLATELGWEPEQGTGSPTTHLPRVSVSVQARHGSGATRYRGTVSALHYLADAPVGRGDLALASRHSLSAGRLTLWGDVLAEQPDSGALEVRRGGVQAALAVGARGRVHVGFRHYRPYALAPLDSLFELGSRDRVEAGAYIPLGRAALSLSAATTPGSETRTTGASTHLYVRALPGDVELDVSGGLWQRLDARTVTAGAGLGRTTGRLYTRAAYRLERGPERDPVTAHEIEGEASVRVARRSSIGAFALHSSAAGTTGSQLQLRLSWGF